MLRLESPSFQSRNHVKMPSKTNTRFPGFQDSSTGKYSSPVLRENCTNSDQNDNENVHLPHIRNDTPIRSKTDRKASRFFKFSAEKQSFTENLISFFTGSKEKGNERCQTLTEESKKMGIPVLNDQATELRRGETDTVDRAIRTSTQASKKQAPPRKTNRSRITVSTKNDSFRPVTGCSKGNGKVANIDAESDTGGYETMYKMKQPSGKFNAPRKRSLEISEYIRRENYKYNERTAKQFLFQKWLKSTELELPEQYSLNQGDSSLLT